MPRQATGQVVERPSGRGTVYALRFRAYGERRYLTLGTRDEGWTRAKAEDELLLVMAAVRRGTWQPPAPASAVEVSQDPTFHEFASGWYAARELEWRATTGADYHWRLTRHLLPFFAEHRLSQITIAEVDRYREAKVREGGLGGESINKTLTLLGQVLDVAEERHLIARNPVRVNPRRRKVKTRKPPRPYLDRVAHIEALLAAGADLDAAGARSDREPLARRTMLATMILAGLRVGELCALRWRDVDLASGRIVVAGAKTDAGVRKVDLLPLLAAELVGHRDGLRAGRDGVARLGRLAQDAPVFATATGKARDRHNVRERVVKRASALASERLVEAGGAPLPTLTPHALRRTFASVLVNLGRDPAYVMAQMGHTDAKLTLSLYARPMPQDEREALARLVECTNAFPHGATLRTG